MKDITLKIVGRRYAEGELEDEMEFVSDAKMYERNGARYLEYEESEFSGFPGYKTTLTLTKDSVKMKRKDPENDNPATVLVFEEGTRISRMYETPYGSFDIEVLTTEVKNELNKDGFGKIILGYDVCFQGKDEGRNELDIEIMQ